MGRGEIGGREGDIVLLWINWGGWVRGGILRGRRFIGNFFFLFFFFPQSLGLGGFFDDFFYFYDIEIGRVECGIWFGFVR